MKQIPNYRDIYQPLNVVALLVSTPFFLKHREICCLSSITFGLSQLRLSWRHRNPCWAAMERSCCAKKLMGLGGAAGRRNWVFWWMVSHTFRILSRILKRGNGMMIPNDMSMFLEVEATKCLVFSTKTTFRGGTTERPIFGNRMSQGDVENYKILPELGMGWGRRSRDTLLHNSPCRCFLQLPRTTSTHVFTCFLSAALDKLDGSESITIPKTYET